ncbi:GDSL esterase/lipase At4g10955 [Medicago truncatula]|uniref:GDSL esterase/lipase At4g10955 n=1 Tax=Medicago truncatula TaxID=3880 RepID=UPI0019684C91|nr:GDSL esterase/lipase At4g10955 [Medicago truncatula]
MLSIRDYRYKVHVKPTQILIDERDGSIFGAIFEWDRSAALSEFKPFKPVGAPRAVLALRGTLVRFPTMRRDFEDDFRFVAWESLKDSVRFKVAMDAVKSVYDTYGSRNVCIAGHSLGAEFGLQVGKELAKERINVETHLFNPPSVSLALSRGNIGEKAEYVWNRIKTVLPSSSEAHVSNDVDETCVMRLKRMIPRLSCLMDAGFGKRKWILHLYVNSNDWIRYFYVHSNGTRENMGEVESMDPTNQQNEAKLFVVSKENQKFLEAHSMKQWWSSDGNIELRHDIRNSKLVSAQLKSLNSSTPSQVILFYYLRYISLATSRVNIRDATDYLWSILKCVPRISGKAQISNGGEVKIARKENMDPEEGKISATHGKQWWPSDTKLHQALRDSKLHIRRQVRSLYIVTPWEVIKRLNPFISHPNCLNNIGQKEEFVWKWNSIKSILLSSSETQMKNDNNNKISSVPLKSWMPSLSGFRDVGFALVRKASPMFNLPFVSSVIRR